MVRPPRIELGLRVPETLVMSLSLRARGHFLTSDVCSVNEVIRDRSGDVYHFVVNQPVGSQRFAAPD